MSIDATTDLPLTQRFAVADVDSHIIEPPDLWTSRISSKWGDLVPHVRYHESAARTGGTSGSHKLYGVGAFAQAGWPEFPPSHPKDLEDALVAAVDPRERLGYMDEAAIYYQFFTRTSWGSTVTCSSTRCRSELATECVRAYNDWLAEFCSADPKRLIPMMMLPFWDVAGFRGRDAAGLRAWVTRESFSLPATTRSGYPG